MKTLDLQKIVASSLIGILVLALCPRGVQAEWKQDSNGWWNSEGISWTVGWKNIDGQWFYFDNDGYMKTGWIQYAGKSYYLYSNGTMAKNTTVNGYVLGSDGAWIQNINNAGEKNKNLNSYDIDVNLKYKIEVDEKLKGTKKEIIEATKRAIFDMICYYARRNNYKYLSDDTTIIIFNIKERKKNVWDVYFHEKPLNNEKNIAYQVVTVKKQEDGSYKGDIEIIYN